MAQGRVSFAHITTLLCKNYKGCILNFTFRVGKQKSHTLVILDYFFLSFYRKKSKETIKLKTLKAM